MNDTLVLERKCSIEEVFEASFIELLKLVPANPYVRALVLKFSGKLPPAECETFDQLKDWVEANCTKRAKKSITGTNLDGGGILVNVDFSEREYGRADYSVRRSGQDEFQVGREELMEIVQSTIDSGGGISEVVEVIAGRIDDDAWNECDPNMDDYGDYEYNEHESSDSGDANIDYSKDEIRRAVLRYLEEHHPELATEL